MTVVVERAMQRRSAKRLRDTGESTADESYDDITEDEIDGVGGTAPSALIASLRQEFEALPKAPEGIVVAGVNPSQVVNLSHLLSTRDALMSKTLEVLEYLVTQREESSAKGSGREVEELLSYPSRATGKRKKMRVDTVALTRGLEDGIKVCTICL